MKIVTNNGVYVQKKDLELIFKITGNNIPSVIIEEYRANINNKDMCFIFFKNKDIISFLNKFSFIINLNDFIDLDFGEFTDFYFEDLQKLRNMRVKYDENKFLPDGKVYDNFLDVFLDKMRYFDYVPNKNEIKNYPVEMQLLHNKVLDILEVRSFNCGVSELEVPEEVFRPVRYTKKQLQQIYYEVLSESLSFEELKPYEAQLYSIFSRMDYTPEILNIIRKIMLINRNNSVDFINDDLLDLILRLEGKHSKFEQTAWSLIDYLYVIGYKKSEKFDSRIMLENDIKIIKNTINTFVYGSLNDKDLNMLSKYNYEFAEIIKVLKSCNYAPYKSSTIRDMFSNMSAFVYLNPNAINGDFNFLTKVHEYITKNSKTIPYLLNYYEGYNDYKYFLDNFNKANSLLLHLYSQESKAKASDKNKSVDLESLYLNE